LGEGLQHQDGHSPLMFAAVPPCQVYDPAFAYELALIIQDGCRRMYDEGEDIFYYLTIYNENYVMPAKPDDFDLDGLLRGLYRWAPAPPLSGEPRGRAALLFSGSTWHLAQKAAEELATHYGVAADLWSATSYKRLREDALAVERWNRLHPTEAPRTPYVTQRLAGVDGPVVAVSDFTRAIPDQISRWVPGDWLSLGTDGFGRSDTREALRRFFEIDHAHIVVGVLSQLALRGEIKPEIVVDAIRRYDIATDLPEPWVVDIA
jgi:pyruvate dehydrogenase E1 component